MLQNSYLEIKKTNNLPRLPLEGSIDLTYRCNNNCRHCWLRVPADDSQTEEYLFSVEKQKWKRPLSKKPFSKVIRNRIINASKNY